MHDDYWWTSKWYTQHEEITAEDNVNNEEISRNESILPDEE